MIMFLYSTCDCLLSLDPRYIGTYSSFSAEGYNYLSLAVKIVFSAALLGNIAWVFPADLFKKRPQPWIFDDKKGLGCNVADGQVGKIVPPLPVGLKNNKKGKSSPAQDHSKHLNQLLLDHEAFAVLLLDSIAEAVCGFDMGRRCVFTNKSFGKTFGFHNDEDMIGFNVHDLIHYKRADGSVYHGHECRILNSPEWDNRKTYFGEELFFRKDGSCFVGECWVHPIKDGNQTIGGVMSITDITSKKNLQKETEELRGHILQSKKFASVGKHVCNVTHDFNNVLMGIRCYTELVLSEIDDHASNHEHLLHVIEATERAQNLIKEIRLFSKPDNEEKKPFDIVFVTKDVLQLIKATIPTNIKIKEFFHQEQCLIFGRHTGVFRVILNVCKNAAQAMKEIDEGVLEVKVYLSGNSEDVENCSSIKPLGNCIIEITDNGCGMDKETMERIYEPYFTTNKSNGGTGLGLSIVNSVVADHKGHIKVDSIPGNGTRFQIMFPYLEAINE